MEVWLSILSLALLHKVHKHEDIWLFANGSKGIYYLVI